MRHCLRIFVIFVLLAACCNAGDFFVYVGTYTNQKSKGIYAWRFHPESGQLTAVGLVAETPSPSFLAVHPNGRFLYAVNELDKGAVTAFALDRASGRLTLLNTVPSRGAGPCHLALDKSGKVLIVANYSSGSVAAFPVGDDGRLGESPGFFQHSGQGTPHAHAALISPDNRFTLVADLGLDEVLVYRLNVARAAMEPNDPPFAKVQAGAGPRHLAFSPNGRLVYLINETQSTITSFTYDASKGALRELETVSTLPGDFHGTGTTAEIAVHPSGKFVYGSNRGHDSIAVFAADGRGGLRLVEHAATQGKTPRNFAIDPSGKFLFAANQNSDNVIVFRIDEKSGRLTPSGVTVDAPAPVCVVFAKASAL